MRFESSLGLHCRTCRCKDFVYLPNLQKNKISLGRLVPCFWMRSGVSFVSQARGPEYFLHIVAFVIVEKAAVLTMSTLSSDWTWRKNYGWYSISGGFVIALVGRGRTIAPCSVYKTSCSTRRGIWKVLPDDRSTSISHQLVLLWNDIPHDWNSWARRFIHAFLVARHVMLSTYVPIVGSYFGILVVLHVWVGGPMCYVRTPWQSCYFNGVPVMGNVLLPPLCERPWRCRFLDKLRRVTRNSRRIGHSGAFHTSDAALPEHFFAREKFSKNNVCTSASVQHGLILDMNSFRIFFPTCFLPRLDLWLLFCWPANLWMRSVGGKITDLEANLGEVT